MTVGEWPLPICWALGPLGGGQQDRGDGRSHAAGEDRTDVRRDELCGGGGFDAGSVLVVPGQASADEDHFGHAQDEDDPGRVTEQRLETIDDLAGKRNDPLGGYLHRLTPALMPQR